MVTASLVRCILAQWRGGRRATALFVKSRCHSLNDLRCGKMSAAGGAEKAEKFMISKGYFLCACKHM